MLLTENHRGVLMSKICSDSEYLTEMYQTTSDGACNEANLEVCMLRSIWRIGKSPGALSKGLPRVIDRRL